MGEMAEREEEGGRVDEQYASECEWSQHIKGRKINTLRREEIKNS